MGKRDRLKELCDLERIIINAVSGMGPDDTIGGVKIHYWDGGAVWLVDIIGRANALRAEIRRGAR